MFLKRPQHEPQRNRTRSQFVPFHTIGAGHNCYYSLMWKSSIKHFSSDQCCLVAVTRVQLFLRDPSLRNSISVSIFTIPLDIGPCNRSPNIQAILPYSSECRSLFFEANVDNKFNKNEAVSLPRTHGRSSFLSANSDCIISILSHLSIENIDQLDIAVGTLQCVYFG